MYSQRLKEIADEIENMRIEIYSGLHIDIDYEDHKCELDNLLFMIQSKLRFDAAELVELYEESEDGTVWID